MKMGRKNFLPYHSCSCHSPLYIAFQTVLAMDSNIKNNVKRFVSNINLYVMSYLCILLALSAAVAMTIFIKSNLL